jgi:hypothetical protein
MVAVVLAALAVTSVLDIASGRVPALAEVVHMPQVVGLVALWLIARTQRRRAEMLVAA